MAAARNRSKNFESCEIQLEDHIGVLNSKLTNSITNDKKKQIWDKITAEINSLGVSNRTSKEIKTKWNNMFQNAKKEFSDRKLQTQKTGGGPCPKPVSSYIEKIMDIYSDSACFNGVAGVESPVPLQETQSVEIHGSPTTLDLLSRVLQEQHDNDVAVPSLDAEMPSCSYTADIAAEGNLQSSVESKSLCEDGYVDI
ncbi:uncharacterized protein LOC124274914 [Haliotis rubra]|uniref:uncharacterized protein LOC124274914 n=1 Tax=Haliotis rubra TaxID=36100 RepID=UPI001EE5A1DE|nr:uncharacterized protein LOC124274914 [Haliotis rubra]